MLLAGVAMVKNEQDIIESFVRHNLQYLDKLYIIDHDSLDGTGDILSKLAEEGLPVKVYSEKRLAFFQAVRTSELIDMVFQKSRPDFVFPLDADEFITASSRKRLEQALLNLPEETFGLLPWRTYVFRKPHRKRGVHVFKYITHRRLAEVPQYYKVVIPSFYSQSPDYSVGMGNHCVISSQGKCRHQELPDIFLAHFPVRSGQQLTNKALTMWLGSLMTNPDFASTGHSWHTHQIYQKVLSKGFLTDGEVAEISRYYAHKGDKSVRLVKDSLEAGYELRYAEERNHTSLQVITRLFERYIFQIHKRSIKGDEDY